MRISILGPMEVEGAGGPIEVGGLRLRALLAVLALDAGRVVTADRLIDVLWPGEPPGNAANALQTLVRRLRVALRPEKVLESRPGGYRLALAGDDVDALRFRRLAGRGSPEEALRLWRGTALAGLTGVPYLRDVAEGLEQERLCAVEARAEARLATGEAAGPAAEGSAGLSAGGAAGLAVELRAELAAHPLRERLAALAVRALAAGGRQAEALELFERTRRRLADELGVDPGAELRAAHLAVLTGEPHTGRPAAPAAQRRAGGEPAPVGRQVVRGNVRVARTSFIGREAELEQLARLLRRTRIVTVVGPGGAGKTRLALETAARAGDRVDACWVVELASLSAPAELPGAVCDALGLREDRPVPYHLEPAATPPAGGDALEAVTDAVGDGDVLLVLDNCEHLLDAAAALAERLLAACPRLRVLATSREPLSVPGEHLAPIPPLEPPPAGVTAAEAAAYPAVRLLVERAVAARPAFVLDDGNVAAVAELCRRLDGLPLAIELAAARLRTMSAAQLADRLDDRFRLLTGGSRTALPRQQTLRAVVGWSWDLLESEERALAARFGVFAGGAALESVEAVCGHEAGAVLGALADKSLVQVTADGRYTMLETIRAYALERLAEAGESAEYRRRHAACLLDLAERAVPELRTAAQIDWIERLAAERDDFAAALRWAVDAGETATALRLCAALTWYWWMCGYRQESLAWATQVIGLAGDAPPPGLTAAYLCCLFAQGVTRFAEFVGDRERMRALSRRLDELVEQAEREGPVHPMIRLSRAVAAAVAGRDEHVTELMREYAASEDRWLASAALMLSGSHGGEERLERAVAGFREVGDRWGLTEALLALAAARASRGAPTGDLIAETWSLTSRWVAADEAVSTLVRLAELRIRSGDLDGAREDLARARATMDDEVSPLTRLQLGMAEAAYDERRGDLPGALARYRDLFDVLAEGPPIAQFAAALLTAHGRALARAGHLEQALGRHRRALDALGATAPDRPLLAAVLSGFALAALAGGDPERAAVLFGASSAADSHFGMADSGTPEATEGVAAARRALGEARFERCFAEGAALTRPEVYGMVGSTT
ncbi:winged helix-turn-helix domain-containing protein [Actinomadura sp. ATCC 31491]|uniref:Winged helix-turn-helix domain-containing protein n=1 Tax=Actinomadura luzonensis TaxID=2805427 RepID=A0ABT0GA34_9ACTN|nr:BTAD domain-containing putative transcriptional regulator [Actinomadura luzonensis]MCK2221464.1 winged helix-turn-helix domain-containing protein [Actinomadura luzonensis]